MLSKDDLQTIKNVVKETIKTQIKKELKPQKNNITRIDNNIESIFRMIQHDYRIIQNLQYGVKRLEDHLNLSHFSSD